MTFRGILGLYTAAVVGAAIGAFWATPYPSVEEPERRPDLGCCPWGGATQKGVLHLPRNMRHGESYLVVLASDAKASMAALRALGDSELGEVGEWDSVQVPRADHIVLGLAGQFFKVTPMKDEERRGLLRSVTPVVWSWEVTPLARGRLRLNLGGSAWGVFGGESVPLYFDLAVGRVSVGASFLKRLNEFLKTPFGNRVTLAGLVALIGWMGDLRGWLSRRRRQRAGFH